MKKVLFLCTGNSCRSILAEAIFNHEFKGRAKAWSSGVAPSGVVSSQALALLSEMGVPTGGLRSKKLDELADIVFDLVVTVCDHAREHCPVFPGKAARRHFSIEDPIGRGREAFELVVRRIRDEVLPAAARELGLED